MVQMDEESSKVLWCGNLHEKVTEELLYELFLQAGPLEKVKIVSQPNGTRYAFVTFKHKSSVQYTMNLMNGIRLFDRSLKLQVRTGSVGVQNGAAASCPGTPIGLAPGTPIQPSPMMLSPAISLTPTGMMHFMPYPPPILNAGMMPPPPAMFIQHPNAGFHRSYSVPEMPQNGGKILPAVSGLVEEQRSPYARPANIYEERQRGYRQMASANDESLKVEAQLRSMRQISDQLAGANQRHQQYHHHGDSRSGHRNQRSDSRGYSDRNYSSSSRRYH